MYYRKKPEPMTRLSIVAALRKHTHQQRTMRPLWLSVVRPAQCRPLSRSVSRKPQDMPPEGGYEPVQYKRNLPARGLKPRYYVLGMGLVMAYGWYKYYIGIKEYNELGREKMWARFYLVPMLQAEEDRDQVRRYYADKTRERDLLGGEAKVYHSDRFVRPHYYFAPPPDEK